MVFDFALLTDCIDKEYLKMLSHILAALIAGGIIGFERSFRGRPAGFRTHTLVCLSSSLLMLVTLYQWKWLPGLHIDSIKTDPTRMAQGIMTGIGFLGAGVIYKESYTVRGLTTAASIWITAAIGILLGVGFFFPAVVVTILTISVLAAFRWIERKMPTEKYIHHHIRFNRNNPIPEPELRKILKNHGFSVSNMSYRITNNGQFIEYRTVLETTDIRNTATLSETLRTMEIVREFKLSPTGD